MRGEMIDRLDGELRMERIETTRLIGGSLRALQDEARRLGIGLPVPPELAADYPPEPARDGPAGFGPVNGPAGFGTASGRAGPSGRSNYPQPGVFGDPAPPPRPAYRAGPEYPPYPAPEPMPPAPSPRPGPPPVPGAPTTGASVPPRRRRAREDGEDNEVMSRLLGR